MLKTRKKWHHNDTLPDDLNEFRSSFGLPPNKFVILRTDVLIIEGRRGVIDAAWPINKFVNH